MQRHSLLLLTTAGLLISIPGRAQTGEAPRHATLVDLTGAAGGKRAYVSAAGWRTWGLDANGRFQAGLGVRGTGFWGPEGTYDFVAGPNAFTELRVDKPRLLTLNTALHLRARVVGQVRVGITIDLAGVTVGSGSLVGPQIPEGEIRPTRWNLLRGGTADRGSLNSEFYVSAALTPHLSLRAGLSHVVNAYDFRSAGSPVTRYHRFTNLGLLGATYTF